MAEIVDYAFLLRTIPYSDSSLILHVLTSEHGRLSLMARGARRAKSPFRGGVAPLYQLKLTWREPRTGNMGTLVEIQRLKPMLSENKLLAGQKLTAHAGKLFPDGSSHGYTELQQGFELLEQRDEEPGLCAATWKMFESSGWTGSMEHCWHCGIELNPSANTYWYKAHQLCLDCASSHGHQLSPGFRKSMLSYMENAFVKLSPEHITLWNIMIRDTLRTHLTLEE